MSLLPLRGFSVSGMYVTVNGRYSFFFHLNITLCYVLRGYSIFKLISIMGLPPVTSAVYFVTK
jgi:hypothetical protein